jgi:hypothetical protein
MVRCKRWKILLLLSFFTLASLYLIVGNSKLLESSSSARQSTSRLNTLPPVSEHWYPYLDESVFAVDLSFLNNAEKPAGKRGFVQSIQDKLQFEDGTEAKFWGTNLAAYALFDTTDEDIQLQANRLSRLGFNLIRIHHHDADWIQHNIFGNTQHTAADTQSLNQKAMAKLDWWIKCLQDEGIYIWLDLHIGRQFRRADQITGFDEIANDAGKADLRGYNYVNPAIQQAMMAFNTLLLTHENQFTGKRYVDDASIAAVMITNENDLTHHYGNNLLKDKNVPIHHQWFAQEASIYSKTHHIPPKKLMQVWKPGPASYFLNDLEYRFNHKMITHLREIGLKVPIVTTSTWGGNSINALPALTAGEMIDVHAYQSGEILSSNPLHTDHFIHWIAAAQIVNTPITVSEWNAEAFPNPERHVYPLYLASQGAYQGWDALLQYAYAQESLSSSSQAYNWNSHNDPTMMATMPAAALLYRRGDVRQAGKHYVLDLAAKDYYEGHITPESSRTIRTAAETGKLSIHLPKSNRLPWLKSNVLPGDATRIASTSDSLLASSEESISDTQQIVRNWKNGTLIINTPQSKIASGWIGGRRMQVGALEFAITTPHASVAVQSLDSKPIELSQSILMSFVAQAIPPDQASVDFKVEPIEGNIRIKAPKGLKAYALYAKNIKKPVAITYDNGFYQIQLSPEIQTHWLMLTN